MKLATLLYIKNKKGEYLLMERLKEPNRGLMSPPGGKLDTDNAESPAECASREAYEECRITSKESDWKLLGIVTEKNYPSIGNIMIFLMEYKNFLNILPEECSEGAFHFISPQDLHKYKIPVTDKLFIWDKVLDKNIAAFIITLDCTDYPEIKQLNY